MIDVTQFRDLIIKPTLEVIGGQSEAAYQLLLGTAIQESWLQYLKQLFNGPALGVFQMEPATHDDIWENFLRHRTDYAQAIMKLAKNPGHPNEMVGNLWYACAMARAHYRRVPDPLPEAGDVDAMAAYWKQFYNTYLGSGTEEEYIENWGTYGI